MRERELRIALGMRGGVSLAVWIGGACAEIDILRRAEDDDGLWARLRRAANYDTVTVDVMAGASAGGLNGVLFAASQIYDFPMDSMRELWVDVADTSKLMRTAPPWLSLFKGDDYFFEKIRAALADLVPEQPNPAPPRLDLRLSATLVDPITRDVASPRDERLLERRYSTGFRFRSPPYPWLDTDFPATGPERLGNLSRLALAGRATSSYPGAFEAASVRSRRADTFDAGAAALSSALDVEMCGVLIDRRTPDHDDDRFMVADGGILDNIPLGLALEAIADAPAAGPTDRVLVYLQPGAPSIPKTAKESDALTRRSSLSVIKATARARMTGEDIRGDIAEIDDHNDAIERAATIRRSTFGTLATADELCTEAERWRASYRIARAGEDARLIRDLLDDPVTRLREDPFPATVGTTRRAVSDARWRSPLHHPPLRDIGGLTSSLTDRFAARLVGWESARAAADDVFRIGTRPLLRLTQTLLEWCIALEGIENLDTSVASAEKALLYRVNTFVRVGIDRPRRLGWVAIAATAPDDLTASRMAERAVASLDVLLMRSDAEITTVTEALGRHDGDGDGDVRHAIETSLTLLDRAVDIAWSPAEETVRVERTQDIRTAIVRDVLVPVVRRLQPLSTHYSGSSNEPAWFLNRVLSTVAGDDEAYVSVLAALEVMCFAEHAAGLPGRRPTRFVRLSAANPTPIAPKFEALVEAARQSGDWWDPEVTSPADQQGIHVALKLAGNELANFSAFLRGPWRANDWMWGRLDAVPTIVELLTHERVLRDFASDPTSLERLVTVGSSAKWETFLRTHAWNPWKDAIGDELAAIADAAPKQGDHPALAIRRALTARRQFELLAELLHGDLVSPPDLDAVRSYRVGAETIRDLGKEMKGKLGALTDTFAAVVVENVQRSGTRALGTAGRANLKAWFARFGLRVVGRRAVGRITRPRT